MARLDSLVGNRSVNAALSWALVAALVASVVGSLVAGDLLWAGFSAAVIAVAIAPAVLAGDASVVVFWPILLLSALPAVARLVDVLVTPLGYLAVAALGLLVVAEIDHFSDARMPGWFVAGFVVMTTMSVASLWTVVGYLASLSLGTDFASSVDAIMWDLIVASAVGIAVGVLFELALRDVEVV